MRVENSHLGSEEFGHIQVTIRPESELAWSRVTQKREQAGRSADRRRKRSTRLAIEVQNATRIDATDINIAIRANGNPGWVAKAGTLSWDIAAQLVAVVVKPKHFVVIRLSLGRRSTKWVYAEAPQIRATRHCIGGQQQLKTEEAAYVASASKGAIHERPFNGDGNWNTRDSAGVWALAGSQSAGVGLKGRVWNP
jgi:hypothetical protein